MRARGALRRTVQPVAPYTCWNSVGWECAGIARSRSRHPAAKKGARVRLDEVGEFGVIARLTAGLEARLDVALGVGDDAAVVDMPPDAQLVVTCDAQVQGKHFLLDGATPQEIGHKALAVNLSDIAAMGAEPRWALVALLAPPGLELALLDGIYAGMRALARRFAVAIIGGNVAATDGPLAIDVTLLGTCARGRAIPRAGGGAGDELLLVGTLGAAAAGLVAMARVPSQVPSAASTLLDEARAQVHAALVAPEPLVAAGRALASVDGVRAMIDVSDGLAADLAHLCARSGTGAAIEAAALPVDASTHMVAAAYGHDALTLALAGGEDYALLCAIRPEAVAAAQEAVRAAGSASAIIGQLRPRAEGLRLRAADGTVHALAPRGWDHLRIPD